MSLAAVCSSFRVSLSAEGRFVTLCGSMREGCERVGQSLIWHLSHALLAWKETQRGRGKLG